MCILHSLHHSNPVSICTMTQVRTTCNVLRHLVSCICISKASCLAKLHHSLASQLRHSSAVYIMVHIMFFSSLYYCRDTCPARLRMRHTPSQTKQSLDWVCILLEALPSDNSSQYMLLTSVLHSFCQRNLLYSSM